MAQEKIVQTAGRDQLGEFAPKFAEETSADDAKARFQQEMVFPIGEPNTAYAKYFTGNSYLARISYEHVPIANVTFEPGCHNNWHIHHPPKAVVKCLLVLPDEAGIRSGESLRRRFSRELSSTSRQVWSIGTELPRLSHLEGTGSETNKYIYRKPQFKGQDGHSVRHFRRQYDIMQCSHVETQLSGVGMERGPFAQSCWRENRPHVDWEIGILSPVIISPRRFNHAPSWLVDTSNDITLCHSMSRCITVSHNVHKFTLDVTYVQKGVQLVTKVCYY